MLRGFCFKAEWRSVASCGVGIDYMISQSARQDMHLRQIRFFKPT